MNEPTGVGSTREERTAHEAYALAGLLQATSLVGRLARTGLVPQDSYDTSVNSLFVFDTDRVGEIYGGHRGLTHGFRIVEELLGGRNLRLHADALRYAVQVLRVARLLRRATPQLAALRTGLERIAASRQEDASNEEAVATGISQLYQQTVSTLPERIQVLGDVRYLQHPQTAYRVRALLLAAIRSATLWHQSGGRWWRTLVHRGALLDESKRYLSLH